MKQLITFCVLVFLVALGMNPEIMASCYKHNWEKSNLRHSMSLVGWVKRSAPNKPVNECTGRDGFASLNPSL